MASATGIPERDAANSGLGDDEPLLGRVGDASQQEGKGIQFNLVIGECLTLCGTLPEIRAQEIDKYARQRLISFLL